MRNLIPLFRQASLYRQTLAPMLRGAKKKKESGGASTEADSNDLINIFKDKTDPEIKPIEEYPLWLFELLDTSKIPEGAMMAWMNGVENDVKLGHWQPRVYDVKTMVNHLKRSRIKDMNTYRSGLSKDLEKGGFDWGESTMVKAEEEAPVQEEEEEEDEDDGDDK